MDPPIRMVKRSLAPTHFDADDYLRRQEYCTDHGHTDPQSRVAGYKPLARGRRPTEVYECVVCGDAVAVNSENPRI